MNEAEQELFDSNLVAQGEADLLMRRDDGFMWTVEGDFSAGCEPYNFYDSANWMVDWKHMRTKRYEVISYRQYNDRLLAFLQEQREAGPPTEEPSPTDRKFYAVYTESDLEDSHDANFCGPYASEEEAAVSAEAHYKSSDPTQIMDHPGYRATVVEALCVIQPKVPSVVQTTREKP